MVTVSARDFHHQSRNHCATGRRYEPLALTVVYRAGRVETTKHTKKQTKKNAKKRQKNWLVGLLPFPLCFVSFFVCFVCFVVFCLAFIVKPIL